MMKLINLEMIEHLVSIFSIGTISLSAIIGIWKALPKKIAIPTVLIIVALLAFATINNWQSLLAFLIPPGPTRPISYRTDPACQNILAPAEQVVVACGAYFQVLQDINDRGRKSTTAYLKPKAYRECIFKSNSFFLAQKENSNNIPANAKSTSDALMSAMIRFGQTMTFTRDVDIPQTIATPQHAFIDSIENMRASCRVPIPE